MIKKIFAAVLAWATLASPHVEAKVIKTEPVVQVVCEDRKGTAVKIGDDSYITAAHVAVASGCEIDGTPVVNVEVDTARDYAIVRGPSSRRSAKYSCRGFLPDTEYLGVGYAFGWKNLTYQPLRSSGFKVVGEPTQMFTGEVIPGMSGGPVFDRSGAVVGIVNMRWPARSLPLKETSLCH